MTAGGRVYPTPEVTKTPVTVPELDVLDQQHPDVFPVSVLTPSHGHKMGKDVDLSELEISCIFGEDVIPCSDEVDNGALHQAPSVVKPGQKQKQVISFC